MDITLEKIDILRERTGVSYKEAKEVLEIHSGDVVDAIISIEESSDKKWVDNMSIAGNEIVEKLKTIIKKGNVSRIILKKDDEILLNIPITAGAIGAMFAPYVSLLGVAAAIATKTRIEIVKDNGEVVDINEVAEDTVTDLKKFVKGNKDVNFNKYEKKKDIFEQEEIDETLEDIFDEFD